MDNHTIGRCSDALAIEVYQITMSRTRRSFYSNPRHRQVVHDAVGEAFTRWLASAGDKGARSAGEHVQWLTMAAASHILDSNPCKRRTARAVRSIASWLADGDDDHALDRHEADLRHGHGLPAPAEYETHAAVLFDAVREATTPVPKVGDAFRQAVVALKSLGWRDLDIATHLGGPGRSTVNSWTAGKTAPPKHWRAAIVKLAALRKTPHEIGASS